MLYHRVIIYKLLFIKHLKQCHVEKKVKYYVNL